MHVIFRWLYLRNLVGLASKRVAYLEPIRNSMQKPIGGRSKITKGGRSVLVVFAVINYVVLNETKSANVVP
jgi:hypothetical protein